VDPVTAYSSPGANFNRYWYANNNPYRFYDPDGRAPMPELEEEDRLEQLRREHAREREVKEFYAQHRALTLGEAIRANFSDNVDSSILGPGGKDLLHFFGDDLVGGIGNIVDGNYSGAARSMVLGVVLKKAGPLGRRLDELYSAAIAPYNKSGLTHAARAWEKHAGRPGGVFLPLRGGIADKNRVANDYVLDVLTNPAASRRDLGRGGVEFRLPNESGIRFNADGSFSGFLDPKR
jgi:hypothetical protein